MVLQIIQGTLALKLLLSHLCQSLLCCRIKYPHFIIILHSEKREPLEVPLWIMPFCRGSEFYPLYNATIVTDTISKMFSKGGILTTFFHRGAISASFFVCARHINNLVYSFQNYFGDFWEKNPWKLALQSKNTVALSI